MRKTPTVDMSKPHNSLVSADTSAISARAHGRSAARDDVPLRSRLGKLWVICAAIFAAAMLAVYAIPDEAVVQKVRESAQQIIRDAFVFEDGSLWPYPRVNLRRYATQRDDYTETFVLNMAVHSHDDGIVSAFTNPMYSNDLYANGTEETDITTGLVLSIEEGIGLPANDNYGRYWQGHLVFIRPLLMFWNLHQIYRFLAVVLVVGGIWACWRIQKVCGGVFALFLVASLFAVEIWIVPLSTKFYSSFAVCLVACILLADPKGACKTSRQAEEFFFCVGAVTVFLDFMTTPLVSLGIPLVVWTLQNKEAIIEKSMPAAFKDTLRIVLAWLLGWVGLWLTDAALFVAATANKQEALLVMTTRVSEWLGDARFASMGYDRLSGIREVFGFWMPNVPKNVLFWACVAALLFLPLLIAKGGTKKLCLQLTIIGCLPFVWWVALSTSVAVHAWAVYRTVAITLFAMLINWYLVLSSPNC